MWIKRNITNVENKNHTKDLIFYILKTGMDHKSSF